MTSGRGIGLADLDRARVAGLPQVSHSALANVYFTLGRTGDGKLIPPRVAAPTVANSHSFAGGIDRLKILAGRPPDPDRADELAADFSYEQAYGLRVGSTVSLRFVTPDRLPRLFAAINGATPETLDSGPLVTSTSPASV